jgi:hypothetical protein
VTASLAAAALMALLAGVGPSISSWPGVIALAAAALVVGGTGALARIVPFATAGGALALIAYTLALALEQPAVHPLTGAVVGAGLVLLPALTHLAARTRTAAVDPWMVRLMFRHWLPVLALGVIGAIALTLVSALVAPVLRGAGLPAVVAAATIGAVAAVAGVVALVGGAGRPAP